MTARARLDLGVACAVFPLCCVAFWANHLLAALSPKSVTPYSPVDDSLVYASAYGFGLVGTLLSSYLLVRAVPRWRRKGEEWLYTALIPAPLVGYLSLAVEPLAAWLDLATKVERHVLVSAETFVGVPLLAAALVCVILARRALATPQPAARADVALRHGERVVSRHQAALRVAGISTALVLFGFSLTPITGTWIDEMVRREYGVGR